MSVEIAFPLEFLVAGTPVSMQAKRRAAVDAWKRRIREASGAALPEGHFAAEDPLAITLLYFPERAMTGDIDNIVKPVLDALSRHAFLDDSQVERLVVQKFEPHRALSFAAPSPVLAAALQADRPILYVSLTNVIPEGGS
jgi:crossover junction endodeoxyribonuclease RusA